MKVGGGILATAIFFVFGFIQLYAGYLGIEHEFGQGWAIGALAAAFFLRITLPLSIGTFLCALNLWGWHWFWALIFTLPTLIFLIPGFIAAAMSELRK